MSSSPRCYDFLVLGSGIAGLTLALKVAGERRVAILTKKQKADSNTNWAQGGIAGVWSREDSFALHMKDTFEAGAGLCREAAVRTVIEEGPKRIAELIAWGTEFSPAADGRGPDLTREGGHSARRILHAKDATGAEIERALLDAVAANPNITMLENHFAIDLITSRRLGMPGPDRVLGVYVLEQPTGRVEVFAAPVVVLATGGCGKVYLYTTNPDIATGDGVAMAHRAGARIANMEFIQFHPTCLYHPKARTFLITEAVRGEGGYLLGADGKRFMDRYHPLAELAPRDIVARAIDAEMKRTGADCVSLDITHKGAAFIEDHFPTICHRLRELGLDMTREPVPVVPAAHYQCGGVMVDLDARTGIDGLYAVGEVACTGLHGANRLASNSLLEALVFAHRAARHALAHPPAQITATIPPWRPGTATDPDELVVVSHNWDEIRRLMWDYVGIVRTNKRLWRAAKRLANLQDEIREYYWDHVVTSDVLELRNIALVADLIVQCALSRPESRGLHYNLDYPEADPDWAQRDTVVRKGDTV